MNCYPLFSGRRQSSNYRYNIHLHVELFISCVVIIILLLRSSSVYNGIKMEEHIYDVIIKPTTSMIGSCQSPHTNILSSSAAEYEVPVTKRQKPATNNIKRTTNPIYLENNENQSNFPAPTADIKCSTNPVYLEEDDNQPSTEIKCSTNPVCLEEDDNQTICSKPSTEIKCSINPIYLERNGTQSNYPTPTTEIKCSTNTIYLERNGTQNTTTSNDVSAE